MQHAKKECTEQMRNVMQNCAELLAQRNKIDLMFNHGFFPNGNDLMFKHRVPTMSNVTQPNCAPLLLIWMRWTGRSREHEKSAGQH